MKNFEKVMISLSIVLFVGCGKFDDKIDCDKDAKRTIQEINISSLSSTTNIPPSTTIPSSISISSVFISDVNGWTIEGDAQGVEGVIPNFSQTNGVENSGYIYAKDDASGGTWYFIAPDKYSGDLSKFIDGKLEFYLKQESNIKKQFEDNDIIIEGLLGEKIVYNYELYPTKEWTKYEIDFNVDSLWIDENNDTASNEKIESILSNITKIMIRGEFEDGPDIGGLDEFRLFKN